MKGILLGLWGCLITLAASYGTMILAAPSKKTEAKATYFGGVDYVKAPMLGVPIISKGRLHGYVVAQFVFTIKGKTLKSLSVTPEPFLVDAAFQRIYAEAPADTKKMTKPDLKKLLEGLRDDVNKRYGEPVIKEVLIERMNFLPVDSVRSGTYTAENMVKAKPMLKPDKSGH